MQMVPHAPQLVSEVCVSMHEEPHAIVPVGQAVAHTPAAHIEPVVQT
jgi:hypothetical protein